MSECVRIRIPHRKICVGDLKHRISLQSRTLGTPKFGVDIEHEFSEFKKPWSGIRTLKGTNIFSGANLDEAPSHIFYIRYFDGLTAESWVFYKDERYRILDVENIDERDEWYAIYCNQRGNANQDSTTF